MDEKDKIIISLLKRNSRYTSSKISEKTGIPQTTIHNRIKKLIETGVIERFTIVINRKKIDKGLVAYIFCKISYRTSRGEKISQIEVAKEIKSLNEVESVSIVTGEIDLIVKVATKDVDALNDFIITKLRNIEGVEKTITSLVLSEI